MTIVPFLTALVCIGLVASVVQSPIRVPLLRCLWLWWGRSALRLAAGYILRERRTPTHRLGDAALSGNFLDLYVLSLVLAVVSAFLFADDIFVALALGLVLSSLVIFDLRWFWLPDRLTFPLVIAGLVQAYAQGQLEPSLIGLTVALALFLALRFGYRAARGVEGLGLGDVKLAAAMGAWLGASRFIDAIVLASGLGIFATVLALRLSRRHIDGKAQLPFGVYLSAGFWVLWICN